MNTTALSTPTSYSTTSTNWTTCLKCSSRLTPQFICQWRSLPPLPPLTRTYCPHFPPPLPPALQILMHPCTRPILASLQRILSSHTDTMPLGKGQMEAQVNPGSCAPGPYPPLLCPLHPACYQGGLTCSCSCLCQTQEPTLRGRCQTL